MSRSASPSTKIRALVTDVDGTLTDPQRRLHPAAIGALRRVTDRGVPVILATGNVLPIALALHRSLGLTGPVVAENGGIVYHVTDRGERVERLADPRVAYAAYRHLLSEGVPVRRLFTDRWRESEIGMEASVPLAEVQRHLRGMNVYAEGSGFAIHLMERGSGKFQGVRRALAMIDLSPAECAAVGDGDNDARLLRAAALGVTFPSGSARARAAADLITRKDGAPGFLEAVRASGLLGR